MWLDLGIMFKVAGTAKDWWLTTVMTREREGRGGGREKERREVMCVDCIVYKCIPKLQKESLCSDSLFARSLSLMTTNIQVYSPNDTLTTISYSVAMHAQLTQTKPSKWNTPV